MKTAICILVLALQFMSVKLSATPVQAENTKGGLEISFSVSNNEKGLGKYQVFLYKGGEAVDSVNVKFRFPVYMVLELNTYYCLRICKEGYKDRMILLNTAVPKGKEADDYAYDFEVDMLDQAEPGNTIDDLPIALLRFNAAHAAFDYSKHYATSVRVREETKRTATR